jgi:hypothetical protein
MQYDFNPQSKYISNDAPGHGASHANNETRIILGNTFDYAFIHGTAIANCGHSFVTTSDEALMDGFVDCQTYTIMDVILGEEKTTVFPPVIDNANPHLLINSHYRAFPLKLQAKIWDFCRQHGRVFISGAYVATDLLKSETTTKMDSIFAIDLLKINWRADHAALNGKVFSVDSLFLPKFIDFDFNTEWSPEIYGVESPDAIAPVGKAKTILRYAENRYSAATAYVGEYTVIVFGFPFETITGEAWRNTVMKAVLNYGNIF